MIYSKTYPKETPMACSRCVFGQGEHETWCEAPFRVGDVFTVPPTEPCPHCKEDREWVREHPDTLHRWNKCAHCLEWKPYLG